MKHIKGSYRSGMRHKLQALRGLILPPRGPTGSVQNARRALMVAAALHQSSIANLPSDQRRAHRVVCKSCAVKVRYKPGADARKNHRS